MAVLGSMEMKGIGSMEMKGIRGQVHQEEKADPFVTPVPRVRALAIGPATPSEGQRDA
jgi:hypothetical protein